MRRQEIILLGAMSDVVVRLESGQELVVRRPSELSGNHHRGEKVMVHLRPDAMRLVPAGALATITAAD